MVSCFLPGSLAWEQAQGVELDPSEPCSLCTLSGEGCRSVSRASPPPTWQPSGQPGNMGTVAGGAEGHRKGRDVLQSNKGKGGGQGEGDCYPIGGLKEKVLA